VRVIPLAVALSPSTSTSCIKHAGPLSQFGGALFGERGAQIGGSIDKAISLRSILKSGKGFRIFSANLQGHPLAYPCQ